MNHRTSLGRLLLLPSLIAMLGGPLTLRTPEARAAESADAKSTVATRKEPGTGVTIPAYNPKTLHRFDFRVVGKSCATCLHHMQDRMKELPGALKVAIMLQKPYGAVVIYDASKVTQAKILAKASEGLTDVEYEDKVDVLIKTIPIVLVPAAAAKETD